MHISKEKALNLIEHNDKVYHYADKQYEDIVYATTQKICEVVAEMPAADVQPIKHGRWYHNTSKYISELDAYFIQACCSCCGRYSDRVDSYSQLMSNEHCSHCGARMDGDKE